MGRGPYESAIRESVNSIIRNVEEGRLKKNKAYTLDEGAEILGRPRNTLARQTDWEPPHYIQEMNKELGKRRHEWIIKQVSIDVPTKGFRVEGCRYGPIGIVRWPVRPRFREWLNERPKVRNWLLARPAVL